MEIPTEEIIKRLRVFTTTPVALAAIEVIEAQAREILELQATICRLKEEHASSISRTRDEAMRIVSEERLERQVDAEARRIRNLP